MFERFTDRARRVMALANQEAQHLNRQFIASEHILLGLVKEGAGVPYLYYCDPVEAVDPLGRPVEPTTFVDISEQLEKKTEMLACHASQRQWLLAHHGVDEYLDSMKRHTAMRGREAGVAAAEAFVQHRGHAYPRDDLLQAMCGAR